MGGRIRLAWASSRAGRADRVTRRLARVYPKTWADTKTTADPKTIRQTGKHLASVDVDARARQTADPGIVGRSVSVEHRPPVVGARSVTSGRPEDLASAAGQPEDHSLPEDLASAHMASVVARLACMVWTSCIRLTLRHDGQAWSAMGCAVQSAT